MDEGLDPAAAYRVWQVDCPCGTILSYGEDESSLPERCEDCGRDVEVSVIS